MLSFLLGCKLVTAVRAATWTSQSALLPEYDWVVVDHGDGFSWTHGITTTPDAVFISGVSSDTVEVANAQTGEAITSVDTGSNFDVHLTKVTLDGKPQAVWIFPGAKNNAVHGLASTPDGNTLAMVGAFTANVTFGDITLDTTIRGDSTKVEGYVVKLSAQSGEVAWARQLGLLQVGAVAFDVDGNVAISGGRCNETSGTFMTDFPNDCIGFAMLLAAADGAVLWEKDFSGSGIQSLLGIARAAMCSTLLAALQEALS